MGDEVGDVAVAVGVVGMLRLDAMGMCASLEVEPLVFWLYIYVVFICVGRGAGVGLGLDQALLMEGV